MYPTKILILAAGKGTRMGGDLPKVLVPLHGKPLIYHLLENIKGTAETLLVVGFKAEEVMETVGDRYDYVFQKETLGTGHAVLSAKEFLEKNSVGELVVLYGDHPFIRRKSIENLLEQHRKNASPISMMTTLVSDFDDWRKSFLHWGRILRDENGNISAIREYKDCTPEEHTIRELNPGVYCFRSSWLWPRLEKIKNHNAQQEYYLTDVVEMAMQEGVQIPTSFISSEECIGVNSLEELRLAEKVFMYDTD